MPFFWLIFLTISIGILLSYKKNAKEAALQWKRDREETEKLEKTFRQLNIAVGSILTLVGILGLFGIIQVR